MQSMIAHAERLSTCTGPQCMPQCEIRSLSKSCSTLVPTRCILGACCQDEGVDLSHVLCTPVEGGLKLIGDAMAKRRTGRHDLNDKSSRSHLIIVFKLKTDGATFSLVDLAGAFPQQQSLFVQMCLGLRDAWRDEQHETVGEGTASMEWSSREISCGTPYLGRQS